MVASLLCVHAPRQGVDSCALRKSDMKKNWEKRRVISRTVLDGGLTRTDYSDGGFTIVGLYDIEPMGPIYPRREESRLTLPDGSIRINYSGGGYSVTGPMLARQ